MTIQKILGFTNGEDATVLMAQGEDVKANLVTYVGNDLADWPEDLGAYTHKGLWIWEGETDGDSFEDVTVRALNDAEWDRLKVGQNPLEV